MMKIGEYVGDRIDWLFDFIGWCIGFILKAVFLAGCLVVPAAAIKYLLFG